MPIEFIEGPNGKAIPAQRVRLVYADPGDAAPLYKVDLSGHGTLYVSHFETCPNAREFSKRRSHA